MSKCQLKNFKRREKKRQRKEADEKCRLENHELEGHMFHSLEHEAQKCLPENRVKSRHDDPEYYRDMYGNYVRYPSYLQNHRTPNGEWQAHGHYWCEFHKKHHVLEVCYVRNSRDVDLLAWYRDDEKQGYIMM